MKIINVDSYDKMSFYAAELIAAQVVMKPDAILGLATGTTPLGTYAKLGEWNKNGSVDFSRVRTANLDEYVGLSGDHDQSYRYFMNKNLFSNFVLTCILNGYIDPILANNLNFDFI